MIAPRAASQANGTLFCNSIGCSNGRTPIVNASTIECDADPCLETQCCKAFSSYHACPNNFSPMLDADGILCPDSGCRTDQCCYFCESLSDRNCHGCYNGNTATYSPLADSLTHATIECST